jgi:hypothetical protein
MTIPDSTFWDAWPKDAKGVIETANPVFSGSQYRFLQELQEWGRTHEVSHPAMFTVGIIEMAVVLFAFAVLGRRRA